MEILGSLLLDICVVLLLVLMVIIGIKKGFFGSAFGIITTLISLGGGAGLAFLFCEFALPELGWMDGITDSFVSLLGGDNSLFEMMNLTAKDLAYYLAYGSMFLIGFIFGYIIVRLFMFFLVKLLWLCRHSLTFKFIDSTVGVIINVAIVGGIYLLLLGFFYAFESTYYMVNVREYLKSTYLTNLIYNSPIVEMLSGIFSGLKDLVVSAF